jgi:peroxidase
LFETNAADASTKRFSLSAINIMRGRDHGMPSYVDFRAFVSLPKVSGFDDLLEMAPQTRDKLRAVYKNVQDVDAFTGGTGEMPVDGAVIGPTFASQSHFKLFSS